MAFTAHYCLRRVKMTDEVSRNKKTHTCWQRLDSSGLPWFFLLWFASLRVLSELQAITIMDRRNPRSTMSVYRAETGGVCRDSYSVMLL